MSQNMIQGSRSREKLIFCKGSPFFYIELLKIMKNLLVLIAMLICVASIHAKNVTVSLEPARLTRIAWRINWTDQIRRLGGDTHFDGGPQRLVVSFDLGQLPKGFMPRKAELIMQSKNPIIEDGVLHLEIFPLERNLAKWNKKTLSQSGVLPKAPCFTGDWRFNSKEPGVFDLTDLVQSWYSGKQMNFGILLAARGDLSSKPDKDMFHISKLQLSVTGSVTDNNPELSPVINPILPKAGQPGWIFPDGSVVAYDALSGKLISDNAGFWGNYQIASGMSAILTEDIYPSDGSLSRNVQSIFDGNLATGAMVPGNSQKPFLILQFPKAVTATEVDLALHAASGNFEMTFLAGDNPDHLKEFSRFRQCTDKKNFFRIGNFKPVSARCFGVTNIGASPVDLRELLLWGEAPEQPANQATGILPEMASTVQREVLLPWFDTPPSLKDLLKLKHFQFTRLNSSKVGSDTTACMAMSPAGLDILWICRNQPDAAKDQVELYINRYDLQERRYYVFSLDRNGTLKVDASAVIDPTKGGVPFRPKCEVKNEGNFWYGHMRLPLSAMAGKEGFESHRWPANLARRITNGKEEIICAYPAVPELHVPMLFALLQSRRQAEKTVKGNFCSFSGISETEFNRTQFDKWRKAINNLANQEVITVAAPFDNEIISAPILPTTKLNIPRQTRITTNEVENIVWYVINPSPVKTVRVKVDFSGFDNPANLSAELGTVGVVQRRRGAMLRPIFLSSNLPGAPTLRRYVRNASEIEKFPELVLPPGHAALVTLRIKSIDATPGTRHGMIHFGSVKLPLTLKILPVTLEHPKDYYYTNWGRPTRQQALITLDNYAANEAEYWHESGYNVVHAFPTSDIPGLAALEKAIPGLKYIFNISSKYVDLGYCNKLKATDFTEKNRQEIISDLKTHRDKLLAAGFDYSRWVVEMWDEPGVGPNTMLMAKIAQTIKEFDPAIQLYADPCCWVGNGFASDQAILNAFEPWYPKYIDVSLPIQGLYFGFAGRNMKALRKLWDAPYRYRGTYIHPCPGRMQLWQHFKAGLNAWGYYSYYAPRANPWNDFDTGEMDYQTVYPGVSGPVITIESEQMREGFEDFCCLTTLTKRNDTKAVKSILATMDQINFPWSTRRKLLLDALLQK